MISIATDSNCQTSDPDAFSSAVSSLDSTRCFLETVIVTAVVTSAFVAAKTVLDRHRLQASCATVVVIGAGPIGLASAIIAASSGRASRIILYEESGRRDLVGRSDHISLNSRAISFLRDLSVDFDNVEGSWQHQCFITRTGALLEQLLSIVSRLHIPVNVRFETKFTRDCLTELDAVSERIVAIVCDGSTGRSASLLGLSDEYTQHSCRAYGAVATIDRPDSHQHGPNAVPAFNEIRIHHLTIDLNGSYGKYSSTDDPFPTSFHLKIYGSSQQRRLALAVPRCESRLVKALKVLHDQAVMRNIFQACFNRYKYNTESTVSDVSSMKYMKYSARLFEVKLFHRMENVAYIEDANIFIVTEGEAARPVNLHTSMDINLALSGLQSLERFVIQAACADSESKVLHALNEKFTHSRHVTQEFIRNGLREVMYT